MVAGALLTLVGAMVGLGLPGVADGMALALFGLGIAEPTLMSLAMSSQEKSLGSTAALLGAIQLSVSSSASPLAAVVLHHGPVAWTALLAVSTLLVCVLTTLSLRDVPASYSLAGH